MRDPDVSGVAGSAWRTPVPDAEVLAEHPAWAATLGSWLLLAPGAHPAWTHYMVSVIHLRGIEGVPPPVLDSEGASHEVIVLAVDPRFPAPDMDAARPEVRTLSPSNLMVQLSGLTDAQAAQLTELLVRSFCDGISSPDSDYRRRNEDLLRTTAEHLVLGGHPAERA